MSVKQSTSGLQFVQWYELRKLYGDHFWKDFAKLRPRGFDSRAQLFDRLAKGDDKICGLAELIASMIQRSRLPGRGVLEYIVMFPQAVPRLVFQSYAIWPHMSVFENVAYGLRVRRKSEAEIKEKVYQSLDLVKMGAFAERNASQLSGGQQQRVAVARACAFSPKVLLFDEPLSNLDAKLRAEMRIELRELQHRLGVTSVYVTHDLEEALAMSDRIIVMRGGDIEQSGSPGDIYNYPRTAFVADFVGSANLISGRLRPDLVRDGWIALEADGGNILYGDAHGRTSSPEPVMSVRTVHLQIGTSPPPSKLNVWPIVVRHAVFLGDLTQLHVEWGGRELVIRQTAAAAPAEGSTAYLSIDPAHCVLLEAE